MLSRKEKFQKRTFDIVFSAMAICATWWIMLLAWIVASLETGNNGLFAQRRIGKEGKLFCLYKIRTMKSDQENKTTVTTSIDRRITRSGAFFRRTKIDELPQLMNVLMGDMSIVGPRPDVEGFADRLEGEDRVILDVRPGITGPASLKYREEELLLSKQKDSEGYNKNVIWPDKVRINREYVNSWSLKKDIFYIIKTVTG